MTLFPGVALVTGAASGIGRQTAVSFAVEGCTRITICDINVEGLEETSKLISTATSGACSVLVIKVDMALESEVDGMVASTVAKWGRLDYAVNAAGVLCPSQRSGETTVEVFDRTNTINYRGTWMASRAEIRQMLKQDVVEAGNGRGGVRGSVVNIASQLGIVGRSNATPYCGSKAAVISMTRCDAIDYSKDFIRVNCVCPGVIETPMTQGNEEYRRSLKKAIDIAPMERIGSPQEVADSCLFLSSSRASFIQGSALVVDGGYTIN